MDDKDATKLMEQLNALNAKVTEQAKAIETLTASNTKLSTDLKEKSDQVSRLQVVISDRVLSSPKAEENENDTLSHYLSNNLIKETKQNVNIYGQ